MPLTILVADDEPGIRLSIKDHLELSGYSVITAATGQQTLEMLNRYKPHLLITDIVMPEMDGYDLVRQVRQQPEFRALPVIFLSARNQTAERVYGYRLGCDVYLAKPFELEELGAVVRNLLDRVQILQTSLQISTQAQKASHQQETMATRALYQQLGFTPRELEVLELLAQGLSNPHIGDRLHLSSRTVEKYVSRLLQKTTSHNRAELMRFAIEHPLQESDAITSAS
jgi:DNA-binding NarL/FixJ family response regulator